MQRHRAQRVRHSELLLRARDRDRPGLHDGAVSSVACRGFCGQASTPHGRHDGHRPHDQHECRRPATGQGCGELRPTDLLAEGAARGVDGPSLRRMQRRQPDEPQPDLGVEHGPAEQQLSPERRLAEPCEPARAVGQLPEPGQRGLLNAEPGDGLQERPAHARGQQPVQRPDEPRRPDGRRRELPADLRTTGSPARDHLHDGR